jgi:hypothetical protein
MLSDAENHVRVDPRVGVARAGLSGAVKRFSGNEHFEFAGRVAVLRERAICPWQAQDQANPGYSPRQIGHPKNSSIM